MGPRAGTSGTDDPAPATPRRPACPRCGYDLRGHVETWADACPIRGECPECGYAYEWAELLNPSRQRVTWLYERARRRSVGRAWATFLRSLAPTWFWRRTAWLPDPRPARALLGFVVVSFTVFLASVLLMYAMLIVSIQISTSTWTHTWKTFATYPLQQAGWYYSFERNRWYNLNIAPSWAIVSSAAFATAAALSVYVMRPRSGRPFRARHAAVMGVYALSFATALYLAHAILWLGAHAELLYSVINQNHRLGDTLWGKLTVGPMRGRYTEWVILAAMAWQWWHWREAIRARFGDDRPVRLWVCAALCGTIAAALASPPLWRAFT